MADEDKTEVPYTAEQKDKIREVLDELLLVSERVHQRMEEGTNNAFKKFHMLLTADVKERIIKLENPADKGLSFGEFILDMVLGIAGAGLLKSISVFFSLKAIKKIQEQTTIIKVFVTNSETHLDYWHVSYNNKLAKIQNAISGGLNIEVKELLEITKGGTQDMIKSFAGKVLSYQEYIKANDGKSLSLSEDLSQIIDFSSGIINSISDSYFECKKITADYKKIEDDVEFEKVVKYINEMSALNLNIDYNDIFKGWANLIINYLFAMYFNKYPLSNGETTIKTGSQSGYGGVDYYSTVETPNSFHGMRFIDIILKDYPTPENSFIKNAITKKGSSATVEDALKDKTLERDSWGIRAGRFREDIYVSKSGGNKSIYDTALFDADVWYSSIYKELNEGIRQFNEAMIAITAKT